MFTHLFIFLINSVKIEKKGDDLKNLDISDITVPQFNKLHPSRSRRSIAERFFDKASDSFLIQTRRRKRDTEKNTSKGRLVI